MGAIGIIYKFNRDFEYFQYKRVKWMGKCEAHRIVDLFQLFAGESRLIEN